MLVPKGKPVNENLATTYVLVDALVDDLCDGGFSGDVEIVLRDRDVHVILNHGKIAATVEMRGGSSVSSITVAEIAELARRERGRVSVYHYSHELASALASRILARPLYSHLSTDFADPQKMISKLARERARHWFIDVKTASGKKGVIQIKDGQSRVIASYDEATGRSESSLDRADNEAMSRLLEECNNAGGTFDVYFATVVGLDQPVADKDRATYADSWAADSGSEAASTPDEPTPIEPKPVEPKPVESNPVEAPPDGLKSVESMPVAGTDSSERAESEPSTDELSRKEGSPGDSETEEPEQSTVTAEELAVIHEALPGPSDSEQAEKMIEIKRLMGEMARIIDVAGQQVDQRDAFSIKLRAGQIKVAEAYPFLDPFGSEFEYLAGEIAFIGDASP
ncbi:MAG TPA: hypothetical protein VJQ56_10850, partial [Blastocatellia bacterium]|nr:hypothetical protein [Blastocatellia bacterium]